MIAVLIVGTLLGVSVFAVGLRRLRDRLRFITQDGSESAESLAPSAAMVLGGSAALAVGLALLPFAAAGTTPGWVSAVAGAGQISLVAATGGGAWLRSRH